MPSAFDMLGDVLSLSQIAGSTFTAGHTYSTTDGKVTLAADGSFVYTPTPNANFVGIDSFSYTVTSPSSATATGTVYINVQPVAPEVSVPGAQTIAENTSGGAAPYIRGISILDPASTNPDLTITFSAQKGLLALNNNDFNGIDVSYTGTLSQITSLLAGSEGLQYVPVGNFFGTDVVTVTVQDTDDSLISKTMQIPITVTSDYNSTTYSGGQLFVNVPGPQTVAENGTVFTGAIQVTGQSPSTTVEIEFHVLGAGSLALGFSTGHGVTVTPTYSGGFETGAEITGTLADVNTALSALNCVEYTAPDETGVDGIEELAEWYGTYDPHIESNANVIPISIAPPPTECGGTSLVSASTPTSSLTTSGLHINLPGVNAVLANQPEHGFVTVKADGDFSYTAVGGYVGADEFEVYTWDGFTKSEDTELVMVAVGEDGDNSLVHVATLEVINGWGEFKVRQESHDLNAGRLSANGNPQWESIVNITFTPAKTVDASEIAFIQIVKRTDAAGNTITLPNTATRQTADGWRVDRDIKLPSPSPWYGYPVGMPGHLKIGDATLSPVIPAWMRDTAASTGAKGQHWHYETFVIAKKGPQQGTIYGEIQWGLTIDNNGRVTNDPLTFTDGGRDAFPTELENAINKWNMVEKQKYTNRLDGRDWTRPPGWPDDLQYI